MINWPIQFTEDAMDIYGYRNPAILDALENSFLSIVDIVSFRRQHPILELFKTWRDQSLAQKRAPGTYHQLHTFDLAQNFENLFDLDVLPGDESLLVPFLSEVYNMSEKSVNSYSPSHISLLAMILFRLVVMRVYLDQPPEYDLQIFWLALRTPVSALEDGIHQDAKKGRIIRPFTDPEQAMLACFPPEHQAEKPPTKSQIKVFRQIPSTSKMRRSFACLHIKTDPDSHLDFPIAWAVDGEGRTYTFLKTTDLGLTGGPPFKPKEFSFVRLKPYKKKSVTLKPPLPGTSTLQSKEDRSPPSAPRLLIQNYTPGQLSTPHHNVPSTLETTNAKGRKRAASKGQTAEPRRSKRLQKSS